MRIRPVFWFILALSCLGVIIFAATIHIDAPAIMQARLASTAPAPTSFTTIELHLSDTQGIPIEQAQVTPSARMTNMNMTTRTILVQPRGQGTYIVQLQLYMAGPWEIDITARADGFEASRQTLYVQVL
jgi:nitrogen fixation protein FixH